MIGSGGYSREWLDSWGEVLGGGYSHGVHLSSFTHTHIHTHTHTHDMYVCICIYIYIYVYTHNYIYVYTHTHTHTHTHTLTGYSRERPDTSGGVIVMQEPSEDGGKTKVVKMKFDGADMMAEDGCKALVMCIFMCATLQHNVCHAATQCNRLQHTQI